MTRNLNLATLIPVLFVLGGCAAYKTVPPDSIVPIPATSKTRILIEETVVTPERHHITGVYGWVADGSCASARKLKLHTTPPAVRSPREAYINGEDLSGLFGVHFRLSGYTIVSETPGLVVQPRITKLFYNGCNWPHGDHMHSWGHAHISVDFTVRTARGGPVVYKTSLDGQLKARSVTVDVNTPGPLLTNAAIESVRRLLSDSAFHKLASQASATR